MAQHPPGPRWVRDAPALLLAALALGVAARALLLALPPLFLTDVSYYNAQAAGFLLRGVDPYGAAYSVPSALATPGAQDVFAYLPGVFAFLVPGDFGTGARLGLVACDIVVAASLLALSGRVRVLMSAIFLLFPPFVVFSTSFLNDSLPAVAFVSLAIALESRGKSLHGAVLFGLALASSQESWFVFPLYLAYCYRRRRLTLPLVSAGVGAAAVAPFLIWAPGAFVYDTLLFQFQRHATPLFSAGPFGLNVNPSLQGFLLSAGVSAPLVVRGAFATALLLAVVWRSGSGLQGLLLGSAAAVTGSLFLLSGDFFWSYLELPSVLLLFWAGLKYASPGGRSTLKEPEGEVGPASE